MITDTDGTTPCPLILMEIMGLEFRPMDDMDHELWGGASDQAQIAEVGDDLVIIFDQFYPWEGEEIRDGYEYFIELNRELPNNGYEQGSWVMNKGDGQTMCHDYMKSE